MNPFHPYTSTTVPPVDGTDLGDTLDELGTDPIHPALTLIRDGIQQLAEDQHDLNTTQVLLAALAGSPDGNDLLGALGLLAARLADPDTNVALRTLPFDRQCQAYKHGWETARTLNDPELRNPASNACAALDNTGRRCDVDDKKRKEMHDKVKKANNQSSNRPK